MQPMKTFNKSVDFLLPILRFSLNRLLDIAKWKETSEYRQRSCLHATLSFYFTMASFATIRLDGTG